MYLLAPDHNSNLVINEWLSILKPVTLYHILMIFDYVICYVVFMVETVHPMITSLFVLRNMLYFVINRD